MDKEFFENADCRFSVGKVFSLSMRVSFWKILLMTFLRVLFVGLIASGAYLIRISFSRIAFIFYILLLVFSFWMECFLIRFQYKFFYPEFDFGFESVPVSTLRGLGFSGFWGFFLVELIFLSSLLIGFALLMYPGFVVLSWLAPVTHVSAIEGYPPGLAFRKAQKLTDGRRWDLLSLFALQVVVWLPVGLISLSVLKGAYYSPFNIYYFALIAFVFLVLNMIVFSYYSLQWLLVYVLLSQDFALSSEEVKI